MTLAQRHKGAQRFSLADACAGRLASALVVDVGSLEYAGGEAPAYAPLVSFSPWRLLGFDVLGEVGNGAQTQREMLQLAIGDGSRGLLRTCNYPMTSSLLEPNQAFLARFELLPEFCQVVQRSEIQTTRLDDVPQARGADMIKIDVQGATLQVLDGGADVVANALVIHTEVDFGPIYEHGASFGTLYDRLLSLGFEFHHFYELSARRMAAAGGAVGRQAIRQLWGDAVFVPNFQRLDSLSPEQLVKLAVIMGDCYSAYDFAHHCLDRVDPHLAARYRAIISEEDGR